MSTYRVYFLGGGRAGISSARDIEAPDDAHAIKLAEKMAKKLRIIGCTGFEVWEGKRVVALSTIT